MRPLSQHCIDVQKAIAALGETSASDVSQRLGVGRREVRKRIKILEDRGLVAFVCTAKTEAGRDENIYRALSPEPKMRPEDIGSLVSIVHSMARVGQEAA